MLDDGITASLPVIDVSDQLADVADRAWAALVAANDEQFPRVLNHGGSLARVDADDGDSLVHHYNRDSLPARLSRVANFVRTTQRGFSSAYPPGEVVRALLTFPSDPDVEGKVPRLSRVVTAPCFAPDRTLVVRPGLHIPSGLYYAPSPSTDFLAPSDHPSDAELSTARDVIDDLLWDFPFKDGSDRANAIALMLLPFVREMIDGPTPLHYVGAPQAGTGKTTLVRACLAPALGSVPDESGPTDDEEWRKKITAQLLQSPSAVFFDDAGDLDSRPLAQALTTSTWRDRILGSSTTVSLPVRCVWAATGNNLRVAAPLARRFVPIRLDAEMERPWYRASFRHPDVTTYALESRVRLAWAALTLAQRWVAESASEAGAPVGAARIGYAPYERVLGGILRSAGISGFLDNHVEFTEIEDDSDELGGFFSKWHVLNTGPLTVREIEQLVRPLGALYNDAPASMRVSEDRTLPARLPQWLRLHRDRVAAGLKLTQSQHRSTNGRRMWEVKSV